jgi:hypothetical protein
METFFPTHIIIIIIIIIIGSKIIFEINIFRLILNLTATEPNMKNK